MSISCCCSPASRVDRHRLPPSGVQQGGLGDHRRPRTWDAPSVRPAQASWPGWDARPACVAPAAAGAWVARPGAIYRRAGAARREGAAPAGGNPLLEWDYLQRIVQAVRQPMGLLISTPGTGQEPERILALCEGGHVRLNVVLLASGKKRAGGLRGRRRAERRRPRFSMPSPAPSTPCYITFLPTADTRADWPECPTMPSAAGARPAPPRIYRQEAPAPACGTSASRSSRCGVAAAEEFFFRVTANPCAHGRFEIGLDGKVRCCPPSSRCAATWPRWPAPRPGGRLALRRGP
jgi:hypothetical protein